MSKPRLYLDITIEDLTHLRDLGLIEHEDFFARNDRRGKGYLRRAYYDELIAICLCQNAATQCIDPNHGFGDFDVWLFYQDSPDISFPYRAYPKTGKPQFKGTYVDFLKRSIPAKFTVRSDNVSGAVVSYLTEQRTKTQKMLLCNAIVGLHPEEIFGMVVWGGKLGAVQSMSVSDMRDHVRLHF